MKLIIYMAKATLGIRSLKREKNILQ